MSDILNEELNKMKSFFFYEKGKVISEQNTFGTAFGGSQYTPISTANNQQRIQNIANMYATVDANGIIQAASSGQKGKKWVDYMTEFKVSPQEIEAAKKLITTQKEGAKKAQDREQNIVNMYNTVDKEGIIRNPKSQFNGQTWYSYLERFKISNDEVQKALVSVKSRQAAAPPPPTASGATITPPKSGATQNNVSKPKVQNQQNTAQRFTKTASSLGIKNAKMDAQSLQAILNQLSGTPGGTPSANPQTGVAALQNTLNQLNAKP